MLLDTDVTSSSTVIYDEIYHAVRLNTEIEPWQSYDMETISLCEGNPPVPGGFHSQRGGNAEPVIRNAVTFIGFHCNDIHHTLSSRKKS